MFDLLQLESIQNAIIALFILGIIFPLVGVHLVVRRLSMMSESLAHITLPGVALGLILQRLWWWELSPVYICMLVSTVAALLLERLRRLYRGYEELAVPILLSGGVALGVVMISGVRGLNIDIFKYLFGSIMGVSQNDLWLLFIIGILVIGFLFVFYKELFSISFDEEHAFLSGIPCRMLNIAFMIVVALIISATINVVGILLVSAILTIPVATSMRFAHSFSKTLIWSVIFSELGVLGGFLVACHFNSAPSGTIVLCMIFIFLIVVFGQKLLAGQGIRKK